MDRLKVIAAHYEEKGDIEAAVDIYKTIAEFEAPKLARMDSTNIEMGVEDITEEELNERIQRLLDNET